MERPDLTALLPEQQRINERLMLEGQRVPAPGAVPVDVLRRARLFNADGSSRVKRVAHAIDRQMASAQGPIRVREFPVEQAAGLYVHFHGGGWVLGSIYEQDDLLDSLAKASGFRVVS